MRSNGTKSDKQRQRVNIEMVGKMFVVRLSHFTICVICLVPSIRMALEFGLINFNDYCRRGKKSTFIPKIMCIFRIMCMGTRTVWLNLFAVIKHFLQTFTKTKGKNLSKHFHSMCQVPYLKSKHAIHTEHR